MKTGKQIIYLSFVSFLLHVLWENAQAPLFQGYMSFSQHFPMCFIGTLGDVAITWLVYIFVALLKSDFNWIVTFSIKDSVALAVIGFCVAVGVEWRALLFDRWDYANVMPIIPYFKVGLLPIIQMTFLLPFSVYLTSKLFVTYKNNP